MDIPRVRYPVVAIVGTLGLLTTACGAAPQTSADRPDLRSTVLQPVPTTTERPVGGVGVELSVPLLAEDSPAPVVDPDLTLNRNDPSSPLGALCWTQREVLNALLQLISGPTTASVPERDLSVETDSAMLRAEEMLGSRRSELEATPPLGSYADALLSSVQESRQRLALAPGEVSFDDVSDLFDFVEYPGFKEFNALAEQSVECTG